MIVKSAETLDQWKIRLTMSQLSSCQLSIDRRGKFYFYLLPSANKTTKKVQLTSSLDLSHVRRHFEIKLGRQTDKQSFQQTPRDQQNILL